MSRLKKQEIIDLILTNKDRLLDLKGSSDGVWASGLEDIQQRVIELGEYLEETYSSEELGDIIPVLERICEEIYTLSQVIGTDAFSSGTVVDEIERVADLMGETLPEDRLRVVFFPYKATMWDSLETIYLAAREDERCEVCVVPIPYFDKNSDGTLGQMHYEGEYFPKDVDVTYWEDYDLNYERPDIAYFHNPYDQYNKLTSVHPLFYSSNLKKYTETLVYCPYYATSGGLDENWSIFPSYLYSDYILVQADYMIDRIDERVAREKIMSLGSPKFDKVIKTLSKKVHVPDEWAEIIGDKKVFFYNTGNVGVLNWSDRYIDKMEEVFDTFSNNRDVVLLWRPHPLFETTLASMRPELVDRYMELKERFLSESIGIYDTTPTVENSIALSYAYIGDAGTSLTGLFGMACKPMFIFDIWGQGTEPVSREKHGFMDQSESLTYSCVEDDVNSLDDFINDRISGEQFDEKKAAESFKRVTSVIDGTSGEKIHQFIMRKVCD